MYNVELLYKSEEFYPENAFFFKLNSQGKKSIYWFVSMKRWLKTFRVNRAKSDVKVSWDGNCIFKSSNKSNIHKGLNTQGCSQCTHTHTQIRAFRKLVIVVRSFRDGWLAEYNACLESRGNGNERQKGNFCLYPNVFGASYLLALMRYGWKIDSLTVNRIYAFAHLLRIYSLLIQATYFIPNQ